MSVISQNRKVRYDKDGNPVGLSDVIISEKNTTPRSSPKRKTSNVRLTSAQLKARRKKWKEKKSSFGSGTIWKYAQTVGPAYLGAPTHPGKKKEVKEYSKI